MNNGKLPLIPTARERMIHSHKTGVPREMFNEIAREMGAKELEYHKAFVEWGGEADRQATHGEGVTKEDIERFPEIIHPTKKPRKIDVYYTDDDGNEIYLGKASLAGQGTTAMYKKRI